MVNIIIAICIGYYIGYLCSYKMANNAIKSLIEDTFESFIQVAKPTKEIMDEYYDVLEEKGFQYYNSRSEIFDNIHTVVMIILGICLVIKLINLWI